MNRRTISLGALAGFTGLIVGRQAEAHHAFPTVNGRVRHDAGMFENGHIPFEVGDAVWSTAVESAEGMGDFVTTGDGRYFYVESATRSGVAHGGIVNLTLSEWQEITDHANPFETVDY